MTTPPELKPQNASQQSMTRYEMVRMELQYDMLSKSERLQQERIALHYSAFAHMALQLKGLIEERSHSGSTLLDDTIRFLTDKIREGHSMEFGIPLTWNTRAENKEKEEK